MADLPHDGRQRHEYLDWFRGLAVLLMILAHLLDSWTADPYRDTLAYRNVILVGGTGTSLFLLLAGVSVGLSAGARFRRFGSRTAASDAVIRRGLEIFALAFLFRLQAWMISGSGPPSDLLKVDILNIMGPSIVAAALLWRAGRSVYGRCAMFSAAASATAFLTPLVRQAPLGVLPDPLEAYLVPVAGLSNFVFFPWMGMLLCGAGIGVLIDHARSAEQQRRVNIALGAAGAVLAATAYAASLLPSPYAYSDFWTSSPAYFFLRVGLVLFGLALAFGWNSAVRRPGRWSAVTQLGRTSLFIYWIHVELIYGVFSRSIQKSLTVNEALMAFVLFTAFMLVCSIAKQRLVGAYRHRRLAVEPLVARRHSDPQPG